MTIYDYPDQYPAVVDTLEAPAVTPRKPGQVPWVHRGVRRSRQIPGALLLGTGHHRPITESPKAAKGDKFLRPIKPTNVDLIEVIVRALGEVDPAPLT